MLARKPRPVEYHAKVPPSHALVPDAILPDLYLTDIFTARGVLLPTYPGQGHPVIRYVLSVLDNSLDQPKPKPITRQNEFLQKLILVDDTSDSDLLTLLNDACAFIEDSIAKKDGGVLVHCHLGQSRSASIVIAYIMRKERVNYQTALEKVKKKRSCVKPNPGFQRQLSLWEEMGYDIHEPDGTLKDSYTSWKTEQKERMKKMFSDF